MHFHNKLLKISDILIKNQTKSDGFWQNCKNQTDLGKIRRSFHPRKPFMVSSAGKGRSVTISFVDENVSYIVYGHDGSFYFPCINEISSKVFFYCN